MKIGQQIERLRKLKKMSLTQLAKDSGVQIATLSRIENNRMTGTLDSHVAIAKALGVDITELYQNLQKEDPLKAGQGETFTAISSSDGKTSQEILARQVSSKKMLPMLVKIEPKGSTAVEALPGGTERFVYVLEGTVEVKLKDQTVRLTPKMSLYFNASGPHSIDNTGARPAKVISVSTPVHL
jgi:transcriptional regulator with XRE-family HTH domain